MMFVIIAAINQIGVQTTSLIAIMGAAGLAVGLAMQGSLANFAAGVLIVMFRPYRVGDYVEAAGIAGSVVQVGILTTVLKTGDNKQIIVPNAQIMGSIITNYSANDTRRVDLVVGIGYDDDIDKARDTIQALSTRMIVFSKIPPASSLCRSSQTAVSTLSCVPGSSQQIIGQSISLLRKPSRNDSTKKAVRSRTRNRTFT